MKEITMSPADLAKIDHGREHALRALSAVRAAHLADKEADTALSVCHAQLTDVLRVLDAIKQRARVAQ